MISAVRKIGLPLAMLAAAAPFYLWKIDGRVPLNSDEARHILFAESLAGLKGYGIGSSAGFEPQTKLPPTLPLLLAPLRLAAGRNFAAMRGLVATLGLAAGLFVYLLLAETVGATLAAAIAAMTLFSPLMLVYSASVMTEVPYLFFSILALYFARAWDKAHAIALRRAAAPFAAAFAAAATRAIGAALPAALILHFFSANVSPKVNAVAMKGTALLLAIFFALSALWLARPLLVESSGGYAGEFMLEDPYDRDLGKVGIAGLARRAGRNLADYAYIMSRCAFGDADFSRGRLPAAGTAALAAVGFAWRFARRRSAAEYYFALYSAALIFWPWSGIRFALPLLPLIYYYILSGLERAACLVAGAGRAGPKLAKALALGLAASMLFAGARGFAREWSLEEPSRSIFGRSNESILRMAEWARANTPQDSVIMAENPPLVTLVSNRKALIYPFTKNAGALMKIVRAEGVSYIMVDALSGSGKRYETAPRYLLPAIKAHGEAFQAVKKGDDWAIYRVLGR